MTQNTSYVGRLEVALEDAGVPHEAILWAHTGGGCYAVQVGIGEPDENAEPRDYLLITDYEDVLSAGDLTSDNDRYGWSVGRYVYSPADGYAYGEAEVVYGGRQTIYSTRNLDAVDAVAAVVAAERKHTITEDLCTVCRKAEGVPTNVATFPEVRVTPVCESCHAG